MYARSVSFHLKPGSAAEFTRILDNNILPVLRSQKGFQNELALVAPGGGDAVGITLWNLKENADAYAAGAYTGVVKALERVIEGTPQVHTYEVTSSTFTQSAARATA
jgi:hypothetical protein